MSKCRAKNPSQCKSPRCPDRSGGGNTGGGIFTAYTNTKAPHAEHKTFSPKEKVRQILAQKAVSLADDPFVYDDHREALELTREMSATNMREMNRTDRQAIYDYSNQDYSYLNRALRRGRELTEEEEAKVATLDRVIGEPAAPLEAPTRLYRSIRPPTMYKDEGRVGEWVSNNFPEGKVIEFNSYLSTSLSQTAVVAMLREKPQGERSQFFDGDEEEWEQSKKEETAGNVVIEMVSIDGLSMATASHMPQETEILLGRDKKFLVVGVDETTYLDNKNILTGKDDDYRGMREYPTHRVRLVDVSLLH